MIPERDVRSIYDDLRSLLTNAGFAWVVENVEIELQNGIPEVYTLLRYREALADEKPRRETKEKVTGIRERTEKETLMLLLDEIERCIIIPIQLANTLPQALSTATASLDGIEIVDNDTDTTVFRISRDVPVGDQFVTTLADAIRQLRKTL